MKNVCILFLSQMSVKGSQEAAAGFYYYQHFNFIPYLSLNGRSSPLK